MAPGTPLLLARWYFPDYARVYREVQRVQEAPGRLKYAARRCQEVASRPPY